MEKELLKKRGRYKQLHPVKNEQGIWVVGNRLSRHNPLSGPLNSKPQALLCANHPFTQLLMVDAHKESGHRGRDGTLSRFRYRFWTTQGNSLANRVRRDCQMCKLRSPQLIKQEMGQLPMERLKPAPPFTYVMVDLFGPYSIKGEVQKRVSGKGYGVIFTDLFSRAVHIEGVFGYDASSFLNSLFRFTSVRGWPEKIFSDPGTQLVGAANELKAIWENVDKDKVNKVAVENGTEWHFGPADSPWHQGAVESLVKSAKRCFHFATADRRLSATEFLTVCAQASNILNERPIGLLPGSDSEINVLTPNCLLIGRPVATHPGTKYGSSSFRTRAVELDAILNDFWKSWTELYAPTMVKQNKWHSGSGRDLRVGDVVVVSDNNALRGQYYLAKVKDVYPGIDGRIRKVGLEYKSFKVGSVVRDYSGCKAVKIVRGVQRLALLVP